MNRLLAPALLLLAACATSTELIPPEWQTVPRAEKIGAVSLDAEGKVTTAAAAASPGPRIIRAQGNRLLNGDKPITETFEKIDSFDVSPSRDEVVFSAKHEKGLDIGLVSTDGGKVNWLPADPADEVAVQWAPRGNKVSYVVRASGGDVVKTFHVPSSYWLSVPFAGATVHALAWDPQGERYAAVYSSLTASDAVDVTKYGGEGRRTAIKPAEKLDYESEPLAPGAVLLRPVDLSYDEKLPVVFWLADGLGWDDALAALLRRARVACVVTLRQPGAELRRTAGERAWVDGGRAFIVGGGPLSAGGTVRISGDASVPLGRVRREGKEVRVAPAVVQSFAAGFIPEALKASAHPSLRPARNPMKGINRTNGSSSR